MATVNGDLSFSADRIASQTITDNETVLPRIAKVLKHPTQMEVSKIICNAAGKNIYSLNITSDKEQDKIKTYIDTKMREYSKYTDVYNKFKYSKSYGETFLREDNFFTTQIPQLVIDDHFWVTNTAMEQIYMKQAF